MHTLEELEQTTQNQIQAVEEKASNVQTQVTSNSDKIQTMENEIVALRKIVEDQQTAISNLTKVKNEFKQDKDDFSQKSRKAVTEMNKLVDAQREQVETFKTIRDDVKKDSVDQKKQIKKISQKVDNKSLTDQASRNRLNIVITGIPESEGHSAYADKTNFFKNDLKLKKIDIGAVYRVGQLPPEGHTYIRPLMVKFARLSDRNAVWWRRNDIPQPQDQQKIKIQADLPRQLREDVKILYKVAKAAASIKEYKSAQVRDYALVLQGKEYTASQLENLPQPIRPSSLACKKSETALTFFSKFCELSNHFPSVFTVQDQTFYSMEQYLAFKRATLSQQQYLIDKALNLRDTIEAKSILNSLRKDHEQIWEKDRYEVAKVGLTAKFSQNKHLSTYLQQTEGLQLGEASKNQVWGIGMMLDDKQVLDTQKWKPEGNLLGKILMEIREELKRNK